MDMVANTWMRAPGESVGTFALESAIDELAHDMKIDPIELGGAGSPSAIRRPGRPLLAPPGEGCTDGAARFGWDKRDATPGRRRDGEWLLGMGVATATYPYYRFPGVKARLRLDADGRVTVSTAGHEMGMGTATVQAQHAADRLGVKLEDVSFEVRRQHAAGRCDGRRLVADRWHRGGGRGRRVPARPGAEARRQRQPARRLKTEIVARDGGWRIAKDPSRHESYASILARAKRDFVEAEEAGSMPMEQMKYSMHSTGAQFAEVGVNAVTGEVRVRRFLGSFDVGTHPQPQAASQFRGGIIMGMGLALSEETLFDPRSGRVMNPSLAEYHVPCTSTCPRST